MTLLTKAKNTVSRFALNTGKRYAQDTQGNFATIFAVSLFVITAGLAAAIDIASAVSAKQRLQDTTDQISLYAAKSLETDTAALTAQAQDYFNLNYPNTNGDIVLDKIERVGDKVNVETSTKVVTNFAGMLGVDEINVRATSTASYADRGLDIALVLDTTGSMRGSKIDTLRTAATELIEELDDGTDSVRVSVVPFAQYVNVGADNLNANWIDNSSVGRNWEGCVGSRDGRGEQTPDYNGRDFPAVSGVTCNTPITPLSANLDLAKTGVSNLMARGWTYIPSGLAWGWRTLENADPFTEAKANDSKDRDRILVLMTDGANTRANSGTLHNSTNTNKADNATKQLCRAIKGENIQIYTIAYELNDNKTRRMLERCATNDTMYFDARNSADLSAAFAEIAANLSTLRLTN